MNINTFLSALSTQEKHEIYSLLKSEIGEEGICFNSQEKLLCHAGNPIAAIRSLRGRTGISLSQAKHILDTYRAQAVV